MTETRVTARAPSNIALIKYMGKADPASNLPAHGSLSMTLDRLCSIAEIRVKNDGKSAVAISAAAPDINAARFGGTLSCPELSDSGRQKLLRHLERVRAFSEERFEAHGLKALKRASIESRCANTFPAGAGIASSASSFAAVTLAAVRAFAAEPDAFERAYAGSESFRADVSALSRQGSGSSCRSFDGPWVLWQNESASAVPGGLPEMSDLVLVVDAGHKKVSSSEAHLRVVESPLWRGRIDRASARLEQLRKALGDGDQHRVAWHSWMEAWEMHSLFHTCADPFTYWKPGTMEVLEWIAPFVRTARTHGEPGRSPAFETPPIVTMDAGPNVHVIVPSSEAADWKVRLGDRFPELTVLEDRQGKGAELL